MLGRRSLGAQLVQLLRRVAPHRQKWVGYVVSVEGQAVWQHLVLGHVLVCCGEHMISMKDTLIASKRRIKGTGLLSKKQIANTVHASLTVD